jgi:hypothetical protein
MGRVWQQTRAPPACLASNHIGELLYIPTLSNCAPVTPQGAMRLRGALYQRVAVTQSSTSTFRGLLVPIEMAPHTISGGTFRLHGD